jgi:hypothetical protein
MSVPQLPDARRRRRAWPLRVIGEISFPLFATLAAAAFVVMLVSPERATALAAIRRHGGLRAALSWQVAQARATLNDHPLLLVGVLVAGAIGGTLLGLVIGGKPYPWLGVLTAPLGMMLAPGFTKAIVRPKEPDER